MASASPPNNISVITRLQGISAVALMEKEFPEPRWAIPGILPEGLSILGGKPKKGKSLFAANIGLAIASGGLALGKIPVEKGTVMYLDLEDTERVLQDRMDIMLQGRTPPEKLYFYTKTQTMSAGGMACLQQEMANFPDLRLVIIDTWAKFNPTGNGSSANSYHEEYRQVSFIKEVADSFRIPILLIHHLRKMEAEDIMDTFSGSLGLTGAADTLLVLATEAMSQGPSFASLHVTGRNVETNTHRLNFDKDTLSWILEGEVAEMELSPQYRKIVEVCKQTKGSLSPKQIAEMSGVRYQTVKNDLRKLVLNGNLKKLDRGKYEIIDI